MSIVAAVRPDSWNFPLFVHVFGAMVLVGGLLTGASAVVYARGDAKFLRLGYWSLVAISIPGWTLMRIGAEWIYSEEGWDDLPPGVDEPVWLTSGALIGDVGGLTLLLSVVTGGVAVYRLRNGSGSGLLRAALMLCLPLLAVFVFAAWAMAGKPS